MIAKRFVGLAALGGRRGGTTSATTPRSIAGRIRWSLACLLLATSIALAAPFALVGNGGEIAVIDTMNNVVVAHVPIGLTPSMVANSAGTRLYGVFGNDGTASLRVVDTADYAVTAAIELPLDARDVAINAAGTRAYVSADDSGCWDWCWYSGSVSVVDLTANAVVATIALDGSGPSAIAVNPAGTRAYVVMRNDKSSEVWVVDLATSAVSYRIPLAVLDDSKVVVNAAGTRTYVTNSSTGKLSVIDTATNSVIAERQVGERVFGVAVNRAGTRIYVTTRPQGAWVGPNTLVVLDASTLDGIASVPVGIGATPYVVALDPQEAHVYVANQYDGTVSVVATATDKVVATIPVSGNWIAMGAAAPAGTNYQGLWWNAPANSEPGWGLNLAHQGDTIFATWFTYDTAGKAVWFAMTADKTVEGVYTGKFHSTRGPAFNAVPFDPKAVVATEAGTGTLSFTDADNGSFNYVIGAVNQTKAITREVFGKLPTCTFGTETPPDFHSNHQDLWWNSPAGSESGWGIALSHQGSPYWASTIFAIWFTYDLDGSPMWLAATAPFDNGMGGDYHGPLYRTSGPRFDEFDPAELAALNVGEIEFYGNSDDKAVLMFDYSVQLPGAARVVGTKTISRQIFVAPGTSCK